MFFTVLALGVNAQMLNITPNDTFIYQSNLTTDLDDITTVYGHIINNTATADSVYWRVTSFTPGAPSWELSVCDVINCYTLNIDPYALHRFWAEPGVEKLFDFGVSPHCAAGNGNIEVLLWLASDSANSARKAYFDATFSGWCVGIEEFTAENVRMYPVPVKDKLVVDGLAELNSGTIKVFDVIGNLVSTKQIVAADSKATINMSNVPAGMYFVTIESEGLKLVTRRIQKTN